MFKYSRSVAFDRFVCALGKMESSAGLQGTQIQLFLASVAEKSRHLLRMHLACVLVGQHTSDACTNRYPSIGSSTYVVVCE